MSVNELKSKSVLSCIFYVDCDFCSHTHLRHDKYVRHCKMNHSVEVRDISIQCIICGRKVHHLLINHHIRCYHDKSFKGFRFGCKKKYSIKNSRNVELSAADEQKIVLNSEHSNLGVSEDIAKTIKCPDFDDHADNNNNLKFLHQEGINHNSEDNSCLSIVDNNKVVAKTSTSTYFTKYPDDNVNSKSQQHDEFKSMSEEDSRHVILSNDEKYVETIGCPNIRNRADDNSKLESQQPECVKFVPDEEFQHQSLLEKDLACSKDSNNSEYLEPQQEDSNRATELNSCLSIQWNDKVDNDTAECSDLPHGNANLEPQLEDCNTFEEDEVQIFNVQLEESDQVIEKFKARLSEEEWNDEHSDTSTNGYNEPSYEENDNSSECAFCHLNFFMVDDKKAVKQTYSVEMIQPVLAAMRKFASHVSSDVCDLEFYSNNYLLTGHEYAGSIADGLITVKNKVNKSKEIILPFSMF